MKLTIEGTPEEIKNALQAICGSEGHELNDAIQELQTKTISKLTEAISIYGSFQQSQQHHQQDSRQK